MNESVVMGLDLSLTSTGLVAVPGTWNGDWGRIARGTLRPKIPPGANEDERIERLIKINASVVAFAREYQPTHIIIEQYAFTAQNSRAHALGELGGLVKAALRQFLGLTIQVNAPASARSFLLGKIPQPKKGEPKLPPLKEIVAHTLTTMGMPLEFGADETDAFVMANYLLGQLGGYALALPRPPEAKRKRRRAA